MPSDLVGIVRTARENVREFQPRESAASESIGSRLAERIAYESSEQGFSDRGFYCFKDRTRGYLIQREEYEAAMPKNLEEALEEIDKEGRFVMFKAGFEGAGILLFKGEFLGSLAYGALSIVAGTKHALTSRKKRAEELLKESKYENSFGEEEFERMNREFSKLFAHYSRV